MTPTETEDGSDGNSSSSSEGLQVGHELGGGGGGGRGAVYYDSQQDAELLGVEEDKNDNANDDNDNGDNDDDEDNNDDGEDIENQDEDRNRAVGRQGSNNNSRRERREGRERRRRTQQPNDPYRRLSRSLSMTLQRQSSSIIETLPETPAGWAVLLSSVLSAGLGYELQLQKSLTKPPTTYGQVPTNTSIHSIHKKLTASDDCILSRPIQPSLFVGTRAVISSTAAYLLGGPSAAESFLRFREIITSSQDGAKMGIDWEIPRHRNKLSKIFHTPEERKGHVLNGPIREPVVIVLHGINNDSSFGYIKSLCRSYASRGWNAAAMNFRGCGGVPLSTPRGYNAGYTGDVRNLVLQISARMEKDVPIFLVGNSLGANVLTKYLGEEGLSGTLPRNVAGGASLGNPLLINSEIVRFPFNIFLALGVKKYYAANWGELRKMKDPSYRKAFFKGLYSTTIADLDRGVAPTLSRNDPFFPYAPRIGYKDATAYWMDSSSYRVIRYISVPFLNLISSDDFLASETSRKKLGFCIGNPNVLVVETLCGGHLGWQESPPETNSSFGSSSWSDVATGDFFESIMKTNIERHGSAVDKSKSDKKYNSSSPSSSSSSSFGLDLENIMKEDSIRVSKTIHSRL